MPNTPKWIAATTVADGGVSCLRRAFSLREDTDSAVLRIAVMGSGACYLNGENVSEAPLNDTAPGRQTFLFRDIPVGHLLVTGENVLSVALSGGGRLWLALSVTYEDGETEEVLSDSAFCCMPIADHTYTDGRETRRIGEEPAYQKAGYDDAAWESVRILPGHGGSPLKDAVSALRRRESLSPVSVNERGIYDFGEQVTGYLSFTARGEHGDLLTVRYGSRLDQDGRLIREEGEEQYVKATDKEARAYPMLSLRTFRYAEIRTLRRGRDVTPNVHTVRAEVLRASLCQIGAFQCSDQSLTRLYTETAKHILRYDSDPHTRSARELAELYAYGEDRLLLFDNTDLLSAYLWRYADLQLPDGQIPVTDGNGEYDAEATADPMYGAGLILLPYEHFMLTGDPTLITLLWDTMTRYLSFLGTVAEDATLPSCLGEWGERRDAVRAPRELMGSALYYRLATAMATSATVLGEESEPYTSLAAEIRRGLRERYFEGGNLLVGGQTAIATILSLRIANAGELASLREELVHAIREKGMRLDVGPFISRFLLSAMECPALAPLACQMLAAEKTAEGLPGVVGFCLRAVGGLRPSQGNPAACADPAVGQEATSARFGPLSVTLTGHRIHIRAERPFRLINGESETRLPEGEYSFSTHT